MYNQFFRLRENPFNVNPDPRYLLLSRQTAEAWDGLKHGIQARKGLLLLTGEVGTGKTTLLNHLLNWLHQQRAPTAFIFNSHLEISHLFDFVLSDFGVKFDAESMQGMVLQPPVEPARLIRGVNRAGQRLEVRRRCGVRRCT
jgi:general secretion pathway protein A